MSISPYFQSVLGSDLDAEELADDALLPKVIALKVAHLKQDKDLTDEGVLYNNKPLNIGA